MGLISHLLHEIDAPRMSRWKNLAFGIVGVHALFGLVIMEDYSMHNSQAAAFNAYVCLFRKHTHAATLKFFTLLSTYSQITFIFLKTYLKSLNNSTKNIKLRVHAQLMMSSTTRNAYATARSKLFGNPSEKMLSNTSSFLRHAKDYYLKYFVI